MKLILPNDQVQKDAYNLQSGLINYLSIYPGYISVAFLLTLTEVPLCFRASAP